MSDTIDFGIDLGTTNSSIACCRKGEVTLFTNAEQSTTTPSVVYVGSDGRMLVGKRAYDNWVADADNTQAEFKRWMGYRDEQTFPASAKKMTADALSAEVLKSLRADAVRVVKKDVTASVITVPAAFGALQCEATARAARLAGFEECPLLQEPIAAAIAYGAAPGSRDQRWMVFDLGGGTLDIAIISTRNGRLAVLDHQGDNRLGGKDIDRIIAEELLFRPISQTYALPSSDNEPKAFGRILRGLLRHAELAKIALTQAESTVIEIFDIGSDRQGKKIEFQVTVTRAELEAKIQPVIERCMALAKRALSGARVSGGELDRVLLVGGPTMMPSVRSAISATVSSRLDCSLDPMTVVARGAALYASTTQRTSAPAKAPVPAGTVEIELAYERASGTLQSPVAGMLAANSPVHEVKIDSEGGFWSSGWIPVVQGMFRLEVMLIDRKPVTKFAISARNRSGANVIVTPAEFSISFMMPMSAPPLPHTIAIELISRTGESTFDPVFQRGSPLPAEARRTYRADQTLKPSDTSAALPIKFWEIEVSEDPKEKWWAGCVQIGADKIRRPIVEGSEIEVTMKINQSRQMTVELFVPLLNQSIVEGVYIPDPPSARSQFQQQLDICFERLRRIGKTAFEVERDDLSNEAHELQLQLEQVAEKFAGQIVIDPDNDAGPGEMLRTMRVKLARLEEQLEMDRPGSFAREVRAECRWTDQVVQHNGTESDKAEMERLRGQVTKYCDNDDQRGLKWVRDELRELRVGILDHQPWYWLNVLNFLKLPGRRFLNKTDAQHWLTMADRAIAQKDFQGLKEAVSRVWSMQPPDQVELSQQQAAQSGLRG